MKWKKSLLESKKQRWIFYSAVIVLVCLAGIALELLFNVPTIRAKASSGGENRAISMDEITYEGFRKEQDRLVLDGESGTIHIPLHGQYVDKLCYTYDYEGLLNLTAHIGVYNEYGEVRERDILTIEDRNSKVLHRSYLNIRDKADYAELMVNRENLSEPGLSYIDFDSYSLSFTEFNLTAQPRLNWYRVCFFWCIFGIFAFLVINSERIGKHVEVGFLVIALSVGTLLSLSLPANKVSWDEEIHFSQAFWMSNYRSPVSVSPAVYQEFFAGIDTWPYNQPDTIEEQQEFNHYLDTTGDYRNGEILWSTNLNKTIFTGYAGSALFLKIGQILHMPFSMLFKFGRLGNLFVYCMIMYLAIKKTPVGKGIMAFLGLMPAPMMLACVYSYDPTVTAFLYLASAYLLWAILEPNQKIGWKEYAVILVSFIWGCRIKAIYAPLLLMGLLIPMEHFRSKREKRLMKGGFVLVFVLLMASFALPFLMAPAAVGDVRGEATSEIGQLSYVLGHPFAYAVILIKNIWNTLPSYVIGENALGIMGHQGMVPCTWLIYVGSMIVILTNGQSSCGKRLNGKQKLWIFILASATVVFIWTSMYLVFTTPGNTYIDGVQGRYYVPILFLVWLVMNPGYITVHLKNSHYYSLVLGLGGTILLVGYYTNILRMFCL
ncbi:MAG: DUF2142 domain-containing protein [Clostridium sp.]